MNDLILYDMLYPQGGPAGVVSDCRLTGAQGAFVYVWRPDGRGGVDVGNWTPDFAPYLRAHDLLAAPIIVPPAEGGDIAALLDAARAFGFPGGPVVLDLETPNLPPSWWEEQFDTDSDRGGFWGLDYGNAADLGRYVPDDLFWSARWVQTGVLRPLPTRPAGIRVWQFVNGLILPSGTRADASVSDPTVFFGGLAMIDDATLQRMVDQVNGLYDTITATAKPVSTSWWDNWTQMYAWLEDVHARVVASGTVPSGVTDQLRKISSELQALITALSTPPP